MSLSLTSRRSVLTLGRRMAARRFESTTATGKAAETAKETASKASSAASEYSTKAAQGLTRVTSAAGPAISGAAHGIVTAMGRMGGPVGRLAGFIERQVPHVVYWSKVGAELSKIVFRGQQMTPPPLSTFQTYFQALWKQVQNPSALLQTAQKIASSSVSMLQGLRNMSTAQLAGAGVVVAECLGFFTVGEMVGRMKIVGYHGGNPSAAHH